MHVSYRVFKDEDGVISMFFETDAGQRQQLVKVVKRSESWAGTDWTTISTVVCKESDLKPRDALLRNATCARGSHAMLPDGTIVFQHSLPLRDLDVSDFEAPLNVVINSGDMLEKEPGHKSCSRRSVDRRGTLRLLDLLRHERR